jgi:hypothetical protein
MSGRRRTTPLIKGSGVCRLREVVTASALASSAPWSSVTAQHREVHSVSPPCLKALGRCYVREGEGHPLTSPAAKPQAQVPYPFGLRVIRIAGVCSRNSVLSDIRLRFWLQGQPLLKASVEPFRASGLEAVRQALFSFPALCRGRCFCLPSQVTTLVGRNAKAGGSEVPSSPVCRPPGCRCSPPLRG